MTASNTDLSRAASLLREYANTSLESGAVADVLALADRLDPPPARGRALTKDGVTRTRFAKGQRPGDPTTDVYEAEGLLAATVRVVPWGAHDGFEVRCYTGPEPDEYDAQTFLSYWRANDVALDHAKAL